MKIFVTVGTQPHQFNRLMNYVSLLKLDEVVIQKGTSSFYDPTIANFDYTNNMEKYIDEADVIITHGGVGSIIEALKLEKRLIIVPRLSTLDEHVDDHQLEICKYVEDNNFAFIANTFDELQNSLGQINDHKFNKFKENKKKFNTELNNVIKGLVDYEKGL